MTMCKRILLPLLCLSILLSGCASEPPTPIAPSTGVTEQPTEQTKEATEAPTETTAPPPSEAELLLAQMTLREKVGQLFIVRPDALEPNRSLERVFNTTTDGVIMLSDAIRDAYQVYPVGGVIQFSGNIVSSLQIREFNAALQDMSRIPLFICVDEEGGAVARLANHRSFNLPKFNNAAYIGASGDPSRALEMGRAIGSYLAEYGFNMNFAPVADVNTNPNNPVIGTRAFSSDADTAAQMAGAMAQGLRENGIIPTFKHFPGHGDTAEDSHVGIAVSHKTFDEMMSCEWLPFAEATALDCVMVGHIAVPEVTGDLTPATLSKEVVTGILREELGFEGLIVTDSMHMGAIIKSYGSGEAAVLALQAGCDIILMPQNLYEAFDAVVAAVEDGTLSEQWLDETVLRILEFKMSHGLWE